MSITTSLTQTLSLIENLITGLVTGFFCCSTPMPPTPQLQPRRQKPVKQTIINALPPTAVAQQQQYQQQQQHLHLPPPAQVHHQHPQNVFICAPSWSQQQQSNIQAMLASSRPPLPRPQVCCRWCQSTNPDGDCRDGFCSSVWNKENLMRPIHI